MLPCPKKTIYFWLMASISFAGCQLFIEASEVDTIENNPKRCQDLSDNDGDGKTDCADEECQLFCPPSVCGDNETTFGEECDDGNTAALDGCSEVCLIEFCGDSIVNNLVETCDDGNAVPGDGCDATCRLENGCGDGIVAAGEACDDGNTTDGDGCTGACQIDCDGAFGATSAVFDASVNSCYLFFTAALDWQSAKNDCVAKGGGHLAVFDSLAENNLAQTLNINDIEIWIGYNDINVESNNDPTKFIRVNDNLPIGLGFENFDPANPQGGDLEDCVAINDFVAGQWRDGPCTDVKTYLCELEF
jgi:cysteine-rich repeat protein